MAGSEVALGWDNRRCYRPVIELFNVFNEIEVEAKDQDTMIQPHTALEPPFVITLQDLALDHVVVDASEIVVIGNNVVHDVDRRLQLNRELILVSISLIRMSNMLMPIAGTYCAMFVVW